MQILKTVLLMTLVGTNVFGLDKGEYDHTNSNFSQLQVTHHEPEAIDSAEKQRLISKYEGIANSWYCIDSLENGFKAAACLVELDQKQKAIEVYTSIGTWRPLGYYHAEHEARLRAAKALVSLDKKSAIKVYKSIVEQPFSADNMVDYDVLFDAVIALLELDPSEKQTVIDTCTSIAMAYYSILLVDKIRAASILVELGQTQQAIEAYEFMQQRHPDEESLAVVRDALAKLRENAEKK